MASNSISMASPQQLVLTFVNSEDHKTTATVSTNDEVNMKDSSKRRQRVVWGASETLSLINIWGPKHEDIKNGSIAIKKDLWRNICLEFQDTCVKNNLGTTNMSQDQLRKRVSNLEYRYRQIKTQMATSTEQEAKRLKASFPFYDALEKSLEKSSNDSCNFIDEPPISYLQDHMKPTVVELDLPLNDTCVAHDQGSDNVFIGGNGGMAKRKRSLDHENDEPYLKRVCELWEESLERQERWFTKVVEMQERIVENQERQNKQLVDGLRNIVQEIMTRRFPSS